MAKKFMVFVDLDMNPCIALGVVNYHREIKTPEYLGKFWCRDGGGCWELNDKGELLLYDESFDFGKYNIELAEEAFKNKKVFYLGEDAFEELKLKTLKCK